MFVNKLWEKLRHEKKLATGIPTGWKLVIAGLIGSGTGLFIFTMPSPGSIERDKSWGEIPATGFLDGAASVRSNGVGKSFPYCRIGDCDKVTCSSISESVNPGKVVADFMELTFAVQCPSSRMKSLTLESCAFPNNRLGPDWLTGDRPIEELTLSDCALEDLPGGSLDSAIFSNLRALSVKAEKIRILRKSTFDGLKNLNSLVIEDNIVYEAESDLLEGAADSLEVLSLDGCLRDPRVLANITSRGDLSSVKILSIQRNSLGAITPELFGSVPNVVSIYLKESKIESIESGALRNTRSLLFLDLRNNLLKSLESGALSGASTINPNFRISMSGNPWNCSCDFAWMKKFVKNNPEKLTEIPRCESPERNALLSFTEAEFCEVDAEDEDSTGNAEGDSSYVELACKNSEAPNVSGSSAGTFEFPPRHADFSVSPLSNGDVSVNLRKSEEDRVSLIWFRNGDRGEEFSREIGCLGNVGDSLVLGNLTGNAIYTICLLEGRGELSSPLNCLAAGTAGGSAGEDDACWLRDKDRGAVVSLFVGSLVIVGLSTALTSFLVIRRNPSLLRGSERIVMVRKRGIEALVMPRSNGGDEGRQGRARKSEDANYLTPLAARPRGKSTTPRDSPGRRDSGVSALSSAYYSPAGSYVSGVEATPSELYDWRNPNARTQRDAFDETPPIPPLVGRTRRSVDGAIPSLSFVIDAQSRPPPARPPFIDGETMPNRFAKRK